MARVKVSPSPDWDPLTVPTSPGWRDREVKFEASEKNIYCLKARHFAKEKIAKCFTLGKQTRVLGLTD